MKEFHCTVNRDYATLKICIYIWAVDGRQSYLLKGNELIEVNALEPQEPTLSFTYPFIKEKPEFLVALVDGLIEFGIKPSVEIPDNNELKSVKYHLEDMRKIVFEKSSDE